MAIENNYLTGIRIMNAVNRLKHAPDIEYFISIVIQYGVLISVNVMPRDELNPLSDPSRGLVLTSGKLLAGITAHSMPAQ
jgi:hypothetical protein